MREGIRFLLGHEARELASADPTMTVLDYLRGPARRRGTKEGCAEGDCGACTVVLAEPDEAGTALRYRAVNACIAFLPCLDGKQLITVEDLQGPDGGLHPVQDALVEHHGSQCGFCTPGFVMSLFALCHGGAREQSLSDVLAGNLCRCTGYGPILEAGEAVRGNSSDDRFSEREAETLKTLQALRDGKTACLGLDGRRAFAPKRLDELARLKLEHPEGRIVAGSTDVGLWVTKQHRELETTIHVCDVAELKRLSATDRSIEIGAAVTYSEAADVLGQHYPDFGEVIRRLGSVQVRNLGTIGGNIANGSPIGDSPPLLIALGARLILRRGEETRELALEDFFIDYGEQDLKPGEFVERVSLPLPRPGQLFRSYKISKRFDQDISAVCGAFNLTLEDGKIATARVCYGGMAATPKRARHCEQALAGQAWSEATLKAAMAAIDRDYQPIDDLRASADYRAKVARNLLHKLYIETSGTGARLRLAGQSDLAHA